MNEISKNLKRIIINHSRKEIQDYEINEYTNLINDLGYDSVRIIEMILDIEEQFNITIDDEDIDVDALTKYEPLKTLILRKINI